MKKWQLLLQQAQTAAKAAQDLAEKGNLTDEDRAAYQAKFADAVRLKNESDVAKKADEDATLLKNLASSDGPIPSRDHEDQGRLEITDRSEQSDTKTFGERFVKSGAYAAFRKEFPNAGSIGSGTPVNIGRVKVGKIGEFAQARGIGQKTLTFPQAQNRPTRLPTVDQVVRDRLTLLDLIDHGQTDGDFDYLQILSVTRNAKVVGEMTAASPNSDLKPVSDLTTALASASVFTYADGYDVTNKLLANAPAFATYMNNELQFSLDNLVEEKLLNGTGTGGEPRGIMATTGVQEQTYTAAALNGDGTFADATVMAFIKAVRRAITKVTRIGGQVTGVVMSPEMDEAIELIQDNTGRFQGSGPFTAGPATLWGRPRITSERLVDTNCILGDWKPVALLDAEGLSVLVFNQHKDYAQRNLNYVRAELSAAQAIWKPSRLVIVKPAA